MTHPNSVFALILIPLLSACNGKTPDCDSGVDCETSTATTVDTSDGTTATDTGATNTETSDTAETTTGLVDTGDSTTDTGDSTTTETLPEVEFSGTGLVIVGKCTDNPADDPFEAQWLVSAANRGPGEADVVIYSSVLRVDAGGPNETTQSFLVNRDKFQVDDGDERTIHVEKDSSLQTLPNGCDYCDTTGEVDFSVGVDGGSIESVTLSAWINCF